MGRTWMTYGSNNRPSRRLRSSKAISAPSRASGFFLSSTAALTASMTPYAFSDDMPHPLTAPASPNAAPRLSAYPSPLVTCAKRLSISALRSSSFRDFINGGRPSDTDRCTASDGVDSTETNRARICRILGSAASRWHAKAPRKTTTPWRTLSLLASSSAPPCAACLSKYFSYTGSSAWTCSAPCSSIMARPAVIAASRTSSSSSPSTLVRNVLTSGKSRGVSDGATAPSARIIADRACGSPPRTAASSPGNTAICRFLSIAANGSSEFTSISFGEFCENVAKSLASAGATPASLAETAFAKASTAASRTAAAPCVRYASMPTGVTPRSPRLESARPYAVHTCSAVNRLSSSGSWSARNSVCAAGPSSRMAGAARSPASAAARTARNCDSTPRRSADATAAPPSSSSAAAPLMTSGMGSTAASVVSLSSSLPAFSSPASSEAPPSGSASFASATSSEVVSDEPEAPPSSASASSPASTPFSLDGGRHLSLTERARARSGSDACPRRAKTASTRATTPTRRTAALPVRPRPPPTT
mmetsp:Transcript_2353/g.11471  ORF Transcript_2353/g.11471 Transcript_2353/m.11471 type:complete len:534 (+) Transcript_2353:3768-5369(+)